MAPCRRVTLGSLEGALTTAELIELVSQGGPFAAGATVEGDELIESVSQLLRANAHPDYVTLMVSESITRDYPGPEGFREAWEDWLSPYESFRAEVDEVIRLEDKLVFTVRQIVTTRHSSVEVETPSAAVWWFEDGKVRQAAFYLDRQAGRRRPIPLGLVPRGAALGIAVVCAVGAFLLCVLADLGPFALLLVGIGTACGWAYDLWLKATPLSFVPFAIAFPLMPFWIGVLAGRPLSSLLVLFLGGSVLATAIHLADAIPDRDADRAAGLRTLAVALGTPRAELASAGLLLLGSLVSTVLVIRRSPSSIAALGLTAVVASGVVAGLSSRPNRVSPLLGKWIVIAAAALAAVPLVAEASGR